LASSPSAQDRQPIDSNHGVDLILGGHDHLYYVSKGVDSWENFDITSKVLGAEDDHGDVLVLKSGTDFRDLSEITLEIGATSPGSVRAKVIRRITGKRRLRVSGFAFLKQIPGKRHSVSPGSRSSESLKKLLATLLSGISLTLKAPVCKTTVMIDVRSQFIRTAEVFWFL
jgi:5'-nucleotidase